MGRQRADVAFLYIVRTLADGVWPEGGRVPSMRRLADHLHMSAPTVQQACRRAAEAGLVVVRPRRAVAVRPGAGERARRLLARRSAGGDKKLAILVPEKYFPLSGAPFQRRLAHKVRSAGIARGYGVSIVPIPSDSRSEFAYDVIRHFDAAFVVEMQPENIAMVFALTERRFPVLLFNRHVPGLPAPSLNTDDYGAAGKLAELLVEHGHRNICMFGLAHYESVLGPHSATDGWVDALERLGVLDECIMPLAYDKLGRPPLLLNRLLRIRPRITGLVGSGGVHSAIAGLLHRCGLRVGRDVSVATPGSTRTPARPPAGPPITSFEIDWDRAGHGAVEMLSQMLDGNPRPKDLRVALNIHLTESIGPAPATVQP